jgi:hypothetical protein
MRRCYLLMLLSGAWMLMQETTFWEESRDADLQRTHVTTSETRADCERLADQHATRLTDSPRRPREWRARAGNVVAVYEGAEHKTTWTYRCVPSGAESR